MGSGAQFVATRRGSDQRGSSGTEVSWGRHSSHHIRIGLVITFRHPNHDLVLWFQDFRSETYITRLLGYLFQVLEVTQVLCVDLGQMVSQGEGSIREHPELLTPSFALFMPFH